MNDFSDFNYANWTADTELTLCNVPWDSTYRDIVRFANRTERNNYISSIKTDEGSIVNARHSPLNRPVRIELPLNRAMRYNYIRARNPAMPLDGDTNRDYYYFINNINYVSPSVTEIEVQLDVWQTFCFDIEFGRCFIERSHLGIAASNAFEEYGARYLDEPEGFELGSEMQVLDHREVKPISNPDAGESDIREANYMVAITADPFGGYGTSQEPDMRMNSGAVVGRLPTGIGIIILDTYSDFVVFMSQLQSLPWISNTVQAAYVIPPILRYFPEREWGNLPGSVNGIALGIDFIDNPGKLWDNPNHQSYMSPQHRQISLWPNWRDEALAKIPERYRHLKKFLTAPYMAIEATNWTGASVLLRPELWRNDNARVFERASIFPGNQRITVIPRDYNKLGDSTGTDRDNGDDNSEFLNTAISIDNFPTIPVPSDTGLAALAGNARSLAAAVGSAQWGRQLASMSAQTAYAQAGSAINLAGYQTNEANRLASQQVGFNNAVNMYSSGVNAIGSIGQGAVSGVIAGGAGAAAGAVGGMASAGAGLYNTHIENQRASGLAEMNARSANVQNTYSTAHANRVADSNLELAGFAANGDYQNTIAGINAQKQDMRISPPSVAGRLGGDIENFLYNTVEVSFRWKMISDGAIRRIGAFWLRYGYALNRFYYPPNDLHVMSRFTYWKMAECNLASAPMPRMFSGAIRGIFEKGVTVWKNPAHINVIDPATNNPESGITL